MEQNILELYPYGDTELWYASGNDWSLPMHVQWRHDKANDRHYGLVMPAVCLYYSQGLVMNSLLEMHDIQGRMGCWLVLRSMVEVLLHKAPGITALAYYKWPDPAMTPIPIPNVLKIDKVSGIKSTELSTDAQSTPAQDPFTAFISKRTGINTSVVRVVMNAICDDAPAWMLEERREIDFGFFKLIAAPFRPNWKEIVAFKFKKQKLLSMFTAPGKMKYEALEEAGVPSALCSPHNIAIRKDCGRSRLTYVLEAIPTKRFEKVVAEVERKRIACGGSSYVASFEKTVESLYIHLLGALENYLHKTGLPFARLYEGGDSGQLRLLPTVGQSVKVRGVGLRNMPVHIIPPATPFSVHAEQSNHLLVLAQAPPLSEMSTLSQASEDMRECKGESDVDHDDGRERAVRLSLPDVVEGKNSGEPMLPCATIGTGDSSGVDRC